MEQDTAKVMRHSSSATDYIRHKFLKTGLNGLVLPSHSVIPDLLFPSHATLNWLCSTTTPTNSQPLFLTLSFQLFPEPPRTFVPDFQKSSLKILLTSLSFLFLFQMTALVASAQRLVQRVWEQGWTHQRLRLFLEEFALHMCWSCSHVYIFINIFPKMHKF